MNRTEDVPLHKFARDEGIKYRTVYMWYWKGLVTPVGHRRAIVRIPCRKRGYELIARRSDLDAFLRITGTTTPSRETQKIILAAMSSMG